VEPYQHESPSEISPTQLILDELRKLHKLFDKFDTKWGVTEQDAVRESSRGVSIPTKSTVVGANVVADDWGGFFDGDDDSIEQHCAVSIVADNWGGLFEQPAHELEERDLDLSAIDGFGSAQIHNKHGLTSNVPVTLLDVVHESAPILDVVHEPAPVLDATSTDFDVAFDSEFSSSDGEAASTDKPSSDAAVARANSADADDSVFSFMTARASILMGEALKSGKGGDSDLQGNHPVDFDRLSILPDALLRDVVSHLPIKEVACTVVLSRR
jgi:hypothetical protein